MIKKYWKQIVGVLSVFALSVVALVQHALAAADTDLVNGMASTTAIFTDNKGAIITGLVQIFIPIIILTIVIKVLFFTKRQAAGLLGGGKRRR